MVDRYKYTQVEDYTYIHKYGECILCVHTYVRTVCKDIQHT